MWFSGHFTPQTPKNHPKYHPETIDFTAVFMVWRAGAPPGPLLAPKWGKPVNFNEFNGFSPKTTFPPHFNFYRGKAIKLITIHNFPPFGRQKGAWGGPGAPDHENSS